MSQPITWRNVEAPDSRSAPKFMDGAASSVNTGFDIFNKIIQQRQAIDQSNVTALNEVGKQNYLDQVQGITTAEGMAAAQPTLEQARAALDPTSRAAVRGAGDARLTSLYQQAAAKTTFDDQRRVLAERPVQMQISGLAAQAAHVVDHQT